MRKTSSLIRKGIGQAVIHIILIISLIMVLYPLAMMVFGAFKSGTAYRLNKWLPSLPLRLSNLGLAFDQIKGYLGHTVLVAIFGITGMILISSMASFAISKLKFRGNRVCFAMILALTMVPGVLTLSPSFILYRTLGLYNNLFALILPMWTGGCVFGVFLLSSFYKGIPNDLFEAADLDGATDFQKYTLIALPLSMPIVATLVIMQITGVWNDVLWPRVILQSQNYTIAAGLAFAFDTENATNSTVKFAGYLVASLPVVVLFIFFNRFYVEGMTASAIKL